MAPVKLHVALGLLGGDEHGRGRSCAREHMAAEGRGHRRHRREDHLAGAAASAAPVFFIAPQKGNEEVPK